MSIASKRWWPSGTKHCFVYCGDDRCDCDGNPNHPDSPFKITGRPCPKCGLDRSICCCFEHYRIQEEKAKKMTNEGPMKIVMSKDCQIYINPDHVTKLTIAEVVNHGNSKIETITIEHRLLWFTWNTQEERVVYTPRWTNYIEFSNGKYHLWNFSSLELAEEHGNELLKILI